MRIDHYIEDTPDVHWPELTQPLNLYTYSNVYDEQRYSQLKNTIVSQLENYSKITCCVSSTKQSIATSFV